MTSDLDQRPEAPPQPPLTTTTSIKPAALILVIAITMLAVFLLINAVADSGETPTTTVAVLGGLAPARTSAVIDGCLTPGEPPSNVTGALIVPAGTTAAGDIDDQTSDPGSYDCSRELTAPYAQGQILGFYKAHLEGQGWSLFSTGTAVKGGEQMLFQKAGNDTFEWIAGVTIDRHSPGSTSWTLRFYQDDALD